MRIKRIIRFITLKIIAMYYYYYSQFMITHFYIELTNLMTATIVFPDVISFIYRKLDLFFIIFVHSFSLHSHLRYICVNEHHRDKEWKTEGRKAWQPLVESTKRSMRKSRCANYYHRCYHSIIIITVRPSHYNGRWRCTCIGYDDRRRAVAASALSHADGRHVSLVTCVCSTHVVWAAGRLTIYCSTYNCKKFFLHLVFSFPSWAFSSKYGWAAQIWIVRIC